MIIRWEPALYARNGAEIADTPAGRLYVTRMFKGSRKWTARAGGKRLGSYFPFKEDAKAACERWCGAALAKAGAK